MDKVGLFVCIFLAAQSIIGSLDFQCHSCHYSSVFGSEKSGGQVLPRDPSCRDGAQPKTSLLQDCRKIEESEHALGHCKLSNIADEYLLNTGFAPKEPTTYGCMTLHGFQSKSSNNIWSERGCVILQGGVEIVGQEPNSCRTYPLAKWREDSSSSAWATCVSLKGLGLDDGDYITACYYYYNKDQGSRGDDTRNANANSRHNYCSSSLVLLATTLCLILMVSTFSSDCTRC